MADRPHVVILGAGFGGLTAARALRAAPVDITPIDRAAVKRKAPAFPPGL